MPSQSSIPWYDDFVGIAYRYYDLRMNVTPLFIDRKEAISLWHDTIHSWVDPSIKIRFLELDDKYWFIMGADSQKPDTNLVSVVMKLKIMMRVMKMFVFSTNVLAKNFLVSKLIY